MPFYGIMILIIVCLRASPLKILTRALPSTRKPLKRLDLNFMVCVTLSLYVVSRETLKKYFSGTFILYVKML